MVNHRLPIGRRWNFPLYLPSGVHYPCSMPKAKKAAARKKQGRELTVSELASMGGIAARNATTPEQRKQWATEAANIRWAKVRAEKGQAA